jgi:hypothetical protein
VITYLARRNLIHPNNARVKTAHVLRQHVSQRLRCPALRTKRNQHLVGAEASERLGGVACARACACVAAAAVVGVQTLKGTHNVEYSSFCEVQKSNHKSRITHDKLHKCKGRRRPCRSIPKASPPLLLERCALRDSRPSPCTVATGCELRGQRGGDDWGVATRCDVVRCGRGHEHSESVSGERVDRPNKAKRANRARRARRANRENMASNEKRAKMHHTPRTRDAASPTNSHWGCATKSRISWLCTGHPEHPIGGASQLLHCGGAGDSRPAFFSARS